MSAATSAFGASASKGPDAVTMRRLAERVGVKAPSLYKHFPDNSSVETALIALPLPEPFGFDLDTSDFV